MEKAYKKEDSELNFRPLDVKVTKWSKDKNQMGAYSFFPANSFSKINYNDLLKPVQNVWFAGEAYNYKYSAYTHGAYLSGEKTAKDIIENG